MWCISWNFLGIGVCRKKTLLTHVAPPSQSNSVSDANRWNSSSALHVNYLRIAAVGGSSSCWFRVNMSAKPHRSESNRADTRTTPSSPRWSRCRSRCRCEMAAGLGSSGADRLEGMITHNTKSCCKSCKAVGQMVRDSQINQKTKLCPHILVIHFGLDKVACTA